MKDKEIDKILMLGTPTAISINPAIKTEITRRQIDGVLNEVRRHLAKGKSVHVIVVKE